MVVVVVVMVVIVVVAAAAVVIIIIIIIIMLDVSYPDPASVLLSLVRHIFSFKVRMICVHNNKTASEIIPCSFTTA